MVLVNGEYVVVEKVQHELLERPVKVYNFQVEDYHTYYVTNCGILAHNMCDKNEPQSGELSDSELRNFGEPGRNQGIRQANGSADEAMNFFNSQTLPETRTVQPSGYAVSGTNSRNVQFITNPMRG